MDKTIKFLDELYKALDEKEQELKSKIDSISVVQQDLNEKIDNMKQSISSIVNIEDDEIINLLNSIKLNEDLVTLQDIQELISNPNYDHSSERKNLLFIIMQSKYLIKYGLTLEEDQIENFKKAIKKISDNNQEQSRQLNSLNTELQRNKAKISRNNNIKKNINEKDLIIEGIEYIDDTLLKDDKYTEEEKREILFEIINHNSSVYKSKMKKKETSVQEQVDNTPPVEESDTNNNEEIEDSVELGKGISLEELKEIISKYGYNVEDLLLNKKKNKEVYLDFLLKYGDKERIESILKTFKEYGIQSDEFEFYKTKSNGTKEQSEGNIKTFVNILLRSSKEVIDNVMYIADQNNIKDIMSLKTAFITSRAYTIRTGDGAVVDHPTSTIYALGAYSDFIKNVKFFKEEGFDLNTISCPSILTASNNIIKTNYNILKYYDLDIKNASGKDPLSSLETSNVCEASEMFVELHKDGIKYLNKNLSRIKLEPYNLVFYNAFYMIKNGVSPFKIIATTNNIQLKGEAVNTVRGGAFGITNDNKEKMLNRYVPEKSVKEKYDKIVDSEMKKISKAIRDNNGTLYKSEVVNDPLILLLNEKYGSKDIYAYVIDNIRISKVKVLRLYSILKDQITPDNKKEIINYILTYNSIIDKNDMYKIDKVVDELSKSRKLG